VGKFRKYSKLLHFFKNEGSFIDILGKKPMNLL